MGQKLLPKDCLPAAPGRSESVDQKLLPKDCLPAAAAAQRNARSAETLSLKHLLPDRAGQISTKT